MELLRLEWTYTELLRMLSAQWLLHDSGEREIARLTAWKPWRGSDKARRADLLEALTQSRTLRRLWMDAVRRALGFTETEKAAEVPDND